MTTEKTTAELVPNMEVEITQESVQRDLIRLFTALENSVGTIKAAEIVEQITASIEEDPAMIVWLTSEKVTKAFSKFKGRKTPPNIADIMGMFADFGFKL